MKVNNTHYRTIWVREDGWSVEIIDQTKLPFEFETVVLRSVEDAARAIKDMLVRGAPLVGVTAAYGLCLAARENCSSADINRAADLLLATRPTAINLKWAVEEIKTALRSCDQKDRIDTAYQKASEITENDVENSKSIGRHGHSVISDIQKKKNLDVVNILTHCNAGWLATVDWGTALAPIYMAHDAGINIHVWVDETRPRNQGAALTAFELGSHGVPHTVIVDNAGGHIMQHGQVDLCIVGTDRTVASGDVCNKIGTYLKALAARDNDIPFYVALPHSTIDWSISDGIAEIPIEERDSEEVTTVTGLDKSNQVSAVTVTAPGSKAANFAFDVTPARLVTGLITDRGVAEASSEGLKKLFPERF